MIWEGSDEQSNGKERREAIENYMAWAATQVTFKTEMEKLVLDYIDYGNCFATVEWKDERVELDGKTQAGFVGPTIKRISPLDILMNPIAPDFQSSPKIVRSLVSLGEVKELLQRMSTDETREQLEALYDYLKNIRGNVRNHVGTIRSKSDYLKVDGFNSFSTYLESDYCELLTMYGDIYDREADELYKNHTIVVVDRHKVIHKAPNPSFFGHAPLYHVGWRIRQDNLWAMGPLDNLVGMQYRIDHIENLKADVFDLTAFPPLKIKGWVDDFEWEPFARVYVGEEGDIEPIAPQISNILQSNVEIATLEQKMEEMAGAPKEAMGFRTPGEKTMYEVQRLENAAGRIFTSKVTQFEEKLVERLLNAMLELARRKMTSTMISVFDNELKFTAFQTLSPEDITGVGRIRPVAARHFAEKSERVQNINNFFASPLGQQEDIMQHFSSIQLAHMFEGLLDVEEYNLVTPYVRITERADGARLAQSSSEQLQMENLTPSGLTPDDYSDGIEADPMPMEEMMPDEQA
jgi:hypothetical protein